MASKKSSRARFKCVHSMWPGFKRGGGGAGYRCYDKKKGKLVSQRMCKACPAAVPVAWKGGKYTVRWGRRGKK